MKNNKNVEFYDDIIIHSNAKKRITFFTCPLLLPIMWLILFGQFWGQ